MLPPFSLHFVATARKQVIPHGKTPRLCIRSEQHLQCDRQRDLLDLRIAGYASGWPALTRATLTRRAGARMPGVRNARPEAASRARRLMRCSLPQPESPQRKEWRFAVPTTTSGFRFSVHTGLDLFHSRFMPDPRWNPTFPADDSQFSDELARLEEAYATSPAFMDRAAHLLLVARSRRGASCA